VLHLVRSTRARRLFVWSCVPYLVLSIFADFLHAHPLFDSAPSVGIVQQVAPCAEHPHRIPDSSCAICQWQRVSPKLQATTSVGPVTLTIQAPTLARIAAFPQSPVPHPTTFRGPPSPSFS
jgi:hypothetical protein